MRLLSSVVGLLLFVPLPMGCDAAEARAEQADLVVSSPTIEQGGDIPREHTCDGADRSPQLLWSATPRETRSFVVTVTDPDAPGGIFTHWVAWDIPPQATDVAADAPSEPRLPDGGRQGRNDFGSFGYRGPCPPHGTEHRYFFRVLALDETLGLEPGMDREAVERAMEGHVIARGELMARYARSETTRAPEAQSGSD